MEQEPQEMASRRGRGVWWLGLGAVLLLMALTFALRAYRLDEQSVWWDDYNGLINLETDDFGISLTLARRYNPESAPFFYVVEYCWAQLVGNDPVAVRYLAVLMATLTVPLLFLFGRDAFGARAGLMAALCFALSPIHLYHGQSIRLYPLFMLIGTLSAFTFMRALRGKDKAWLWWIANVAANFLLMRTHLFGVFLVFTQGCVLLLFFGRVRWRIGLWGLVHVACVYPLIAYVRAMPYVEAEGYDHFQAPPLSEIFLDLAGDDAISTAYQVIPDGRTWAFLSEGGRHAFERLRVLSDYGLVVLFCVCGAWLVWRGAGLAWAHWKKKGGAGAQTHLSDLVLLLSVWALPVLVLSFLSYAWRPCIYPRYTLYSSAALYVIVGGAVVALPKRSLRISAAAAIVALYLAQLSFILPASTRTDWQGAAQTVRENTTPEDLVLVGGPGPAYPHINIFTFNMGYTDVPIVPVHTLQAVIDKSVCFFAATDMSRSTERVVYAIWQREYAYGPMERFEQCLNANGLNFERTDLLAMEKLSVYRITPGRSLAKYDGVVQFAIDDEVDHVGILAGIGVDYAEIVQTRPNIIPILRRVIDYPRPIDLGDLPVSSSWLSDEGAPELEVAGGKKLLEQDPNSALAHVKLVWAYLAVGDTDAAIAIGEKGIELSPGNAGARVALSLAYYRKGDTAKALELVDRAVELDDFYIKRHAPVLRALYEDGDLEKARREAYALRAMHGYCAAAFMHELGLQAWLSPCSATPPE